MTSGGGGSGSGGVARLDAVVVVAAGPGGRVDVRSIAAAAQRDEAQRRDARDAATRQKIHGAAEPQSADVAAPPAENVVVFAMFLGHSQAGVRDLRRRCCAVGGNVQFR